MGYRWAPCLTSSSIYPIMIAYDCPCQTNALGAVTTHILHMPSKHYHLLTREAAISWINFMPYASLISHEYCCCYYIVNGIIIHMSMIYEYYVWRQQAITLTSADLLLILTLGNIFQWNLNKNTTILIQENIFENFVCKMVAILYWPQHVKPHACMTSVPETSPTCHPPIDS